MLIPEGKGHWRCLQNTVGILPCLSKLCFPGLEFSDVAQHHHQAVLLPFRATQELPGCNSKKDARTILASLVHLIAHRLSGLQGMLEMTHGLVAFCSVGHQRLEPVPARASDLVYRVAMHGGIGRVDLIKCGIGTQDHDAFCGAVDDLPPVGLLLGELDLLVFDVGQIGDGHHEVGAEIIGPLGQPFQVAAQVDSTAVLGNGPGLQVSCARSHGLFQGIEELWPGLAQYRLPVGLSAQQIPCRGIGFQDGAGAVQHHDTLLTTIQQRLPTRLMGLFHGDIAPFNAVAHELPDDDHRADHQGEGIAGQFDAAVMGGLFRMGTLGQALEDAPGVGWVPVEGIDGAAHQFVCGKPRDDLGNMRLALGEEVPAGLVDVGDGQARACEHEHVGAGVNSGIDGFGKCSAGFLVRLQEPQRITLIGSLVGDDIDDDAEQPRGTPG